MKSSVSNFSASLPAVITGVNMNMKLMFDVISVFIMRLMSIEM